MPSDIPGGEGGTLWGSAFLQMRVGCREDGMTNKDSEKNKRANGSDSNVVVSTDQGTSERLKWVIEVPDKETGRAFRIRCVVDER